MERPRPTKPGASHKSVYAAILCDLAIAATKFTAATASGSSAMLAESIHSIIDAGNGGLLLWGVRQSQKPPDESHPFGHGKELYFWTLIVALLIFAIGGGVTGYEGVVHLLRPKQPGNPRWNYLVLAVSAVFELATVCIAIREFRQREGTVELWRGIKATKDPATFTVLLGNVAALFGLLIAFVGILLSTLLHNASFDGWASVLIGILLACVSIVLSIEIKGLLIGEGADEQIIDQIHNLAKSEPSITQVGHPLTMYFGPQTALLALDVQFRDGLTSQEVAGAIDRLESQIRSRYPEIKKIFIEAEVFSKQPAASQAQSPS